MCQMMIEYICASCRIYTPEILDVFYAPDTFYKPKKKKILTSQDI